MSHPVSPRVSSLVVSHTQCPVFLCILVQCRSDLYLTRYHPASPTLTSPLFMSSCLECLYSLRLLLTGFSPRSFSHLSVSIQSESPLHSVSFLPNSPHPVPLLTRYFLPHRPSSCTHRVPRLSEARRTLWGNCLTLLLMLQRLGARGWTDPGNWTEEDREGIRLGSQSNEEPEQNRKRKYIYWERGNMKMKATEWEEINNDVNRWKKNSGYKTMVWEEMICISLEGWWRRKKN